MIRLALLAFAATLSVPTVAAATASPPAGGVTVDIRPTDSAVVLGDSTDLTVTVTNTSDQPTASLVVHLDVTDPTSSSSVDPEDWTSTLSRPVGTLDPGESTTADWTIQPISPGTFSVYAVALSPDTSEVAASGVLRVEVADQRSLNPGGILPVALGMPILVGGLLLARTFAARRSTRPVAA